MKTFRVIYADGATLDVNTDSEATAKAHAEAQEAERAEKAKKAGIDIPGRAVARIEVVDKLAERQASAKAASGS